MLGVLNIVIVLTSIQNFNKKKGSELTAPLFF